MAELKRKVALKQKHGAVEESPPAAPPPAPPPAIKWWLWLIAGLVVVGGIVFFLTRGSDSPTGKSEKDNTAEITPQQPATPSQPADTVKPATQPATPPIPYNKGEAYQLYQFPFGDANCSKPNPELDKLVKAMTENQDIKIQIFAYTDKVGSAAYNQALSVKRAKAVYDYLASKGIDKSRLTYQGKGILTKYGSNAENRRAEFVLQ
ncbi:MAG: OmpA family protein [Prevotellaceae bacterium]|jgi:outer membrane protein OmpA-like peptidoglycan-associated protein|nr:OmpA family protein [Prevotellaceae bacterium]